MEIPRFSHAAKCLAEAATTLSAAAHAMAMAAQAFSAAGAELEKLRFSAAGEVSVPTETTPHEQNPTVDRTECDNMDNNALAKPTRHEENQSQPDNDYYMTDDDEEYINALLERQRAEEASRQKSENTQTEDSQPNIAVPSPPRPALEPISIPPPLDQDFPSHFQRHLLVDSETKVLPIVSGLALYYDKLVCYMHCALPAIMMYQKIIKGVTCSKVYAVTGADLGTSDTTCKAFNKQEKAILLLPETLRSALTLDSTDKLCVIHVGWPSNVERYRSQIRFHDAPCSILVACTWDRAIYPWCQEALDETAPWPEDDKSRFDVLVSTMRPRVEYVLGSVPRSTKEQFYRDWIEVHGQHGERYVQIWSPVVLAYRANLHLLEVLDYHSQDQDLVRSNRPFPPVTPEFVARNGLEAAAKQGMLNVITPEPIPEPMNPSTDIKPKKLAKQEALSKASNLPKFQPTHIPAAASQSSTGPHVLPGIHVPYPKTPDTLSQHTATSRTKKATKFEPETMSEAKPFDLKTPFTSDLHSASTKGLLSKSPSEYLVVSDDFQVIPAICLLAKDKAYRNTICYVKIVGVIETLSAQVQAVISKPVFIVATPNAKSIPNVVKAFDSPAGALVFCNMLLPLCPQLRTKPVHQIIHSGFTGKSDVYSQQVGTMDLVRSRLVLTQSEYSAMSEPERVSVAPHIHLTRFKVPPGVLHPIIQQWQAQLNSSTDKALNGCYMEWMKYYGVGTYKVKDWSPIELAARANQFVERVLRKDPKRDGLKITEGFARHMRLQPAIDAGLLQVMPPV